MVLCGSDTNKTTTQRRFVKQPQAYTMLKNINNGFILAKPKPSWNMQYKQYIQRLTLSDNYNLHVPSQ